jgi:hypothetical protein
MNDELNLDKKEIKIRKSWPDNFSPETKIHKVKNDYKRSQNKSEIEKTLEQEELDNASGSDLDWLP